MPVAGSLSNKKVVLIGGAGFIGHSLALELTRRGAMVEIVDSLQVNNLLWVTTNVEDPDIRELYLRVLHERFELIRAAGIPLHPQDARDYHGLSRIIGRIKPHAIVHLAAVAHANRSNKDPYSTFDHSLRTLENALDTARDISEHFVYLSSSMAYGNFQAETVAEDHALDPIGIYGALKVAGEKMVIAYQQVFNLAYTIVRPSALYGPRCVSRRVGQVFIENAIRGLPLRMDGDGMDRLDFTYIDDLVEGICLTLEKPAARNQIFNLTYGNGRAVRDLISILRDFFPKLHVDMVERDKLMPERGTLNVDKAKRLLGYAPKNPIDVGYPKYIEWYLKTLKPTEAGRSPAARPDGNQR
jgi:nucleoside-diphosphate-sugar epimerase